MINSNCTTYAYKFAKNIFFIIKIKFILIFKMQLKLEGLICLELGVKTSYKKKKSIIDFLTSNGATISFILNKKCKFLVIDDKTNIDTYKCRTAFKLKIPIIHIELFYKLILDKNQNIKVEDYVIQDKSFKNNFKKGIIQLGINIKYNQNLKKYF